MNPRFIQTLLENRRIGRAAIPSQSAAWRFADALIGTLFPHFSSEEEFFVAKEIEGRLALLAGDLRRLLRPIEGQLGKPVDEVVGALFAALPEITRKLDLDARAIRDGDPAAESYDEVVQAYPGFYAIAVHRIAHQIYQSGVPILPRLLSEHAHRQTGIDIHPGAQIGESLCIDHGTGIVVGETAVLGDHVKLYQGVTLGALSVSKQMVDTKRHPTIEDRVVIYGSAIILGGETVVGHDSVIGGNVWLTESVPPHSVVVHKSEVHVRRKAGSADLLEFHI